MNRIDRIFSDLRNADRKALMPFVCAGWPTPESTATMIRRLDDAGASIVEIGIPFSDPIADGPTIAAAMHRALEAGVTPRAVMDTVRSARDHTDLGLVAMVSISIVARFGPADFARLARDAGFDAVIYPDLPVEEADTYTAPARDAGLTATLLIAPNTPPDRAARIAAASDGFVYLITRVGITGEGQGPGAVRDRITRLRDHTDLPIACGFGISTPDQVRAVTTEGDADAAIVGSALVRRMTDAHQNAADPAEAGLDLVRELARGLE